MIKHRWKRPDLGLCSMYLIFLSLSGCGGLVGNSQIQSDSRIQIWQAGESQVELRAAQSRTFNATTRDELLAAAIHTVQDLGFQIEVLEEALGLVSAKKYVSLSRPRGAELKAYLIYDEESLLIFNKNIRTWAPFRRRSDLVRLTITVRERDAGQMVVRAAAQFYLRPIEDPRAYQKFFDSLEKTLFAGSALHEAAPLRVPGEPVQEPELPAPDSPNSGSPGSSKG